MGWFSNDTPDESETDKGLNDLSNKDLKKLLDAIKQDPRGKNDDDKKPKKGLW